MLLVQRPPGLLLSEGIHGNALHQPESIASSGLGVALRAGALVRGRRRKRTVASHELIETITDAEVGLARVVGPPLAWYDPSNGEIGDICNAQQGSISGFTVQKEWSNSAGACIVHK